MRIVFFIETAEAGGAERIVVLLAEAYQKRGDAVHVLTLQDGWLTEELAKKSLPVTRLRSERSYDVMLPVRIGNFCRAFKADVLHSHLLDSNFYGALAARFSGVRHVATDHGDIHLPAKKRLLKTKLKAVSMCGSSLTAVSQYTSNKLIELGVREQLVSTVYNPIHALDRDPSARTAIRSELGVEEDTWAWVHAAMMTPVKDQGLMIRALAKCKQSHPETRQVLLLAGDGPERERLEQLAKELSVAGEVFFLGFRNDIERVLSAGDGFILSSLSESMPMALLEAASMGLVPVSSAVGGVPEVLTSDRGYLFPSCDDKSLASVMIEVLNNPSEAERKATQAKAFVREAFNFETILSQYDALYAGK